MRLRFTDGVPSGRWISLAYAASWLDPVVRPILRFDTVRGHHDVLAPAPLFGRAIWTGYVPDGTREIQVCPVNQPGPFGFAVERCDVLSPPALLARAWAHDKPRTLQAIAARLTEGRREAQRLLTLALGGTPFKRYHAWRAERLRDFDPADLDAPRTDWSQGPHIRLAVAADGHDLAAVAALLESLARQPWPHWSLALITRQPFVLPPEVDAHVRSGRVRVLDRAGRTAALLDGIDGEALVAAIRAGDTLPPPALAVLAEHAVRHPAQSLFYADEDERDGAGRHAGPRLKPDWSPTFQAIGRYVGRALFVRRRWLEGADAPSLDHIATNGLAALLDRAPHDEVAHIRRVLLTRQRKEGAPPVILSAANESAVSETKNDGAGESQAPPAAEQSPQGPSLRSGRREQTGVTIIIPNRDQPRLLQACLRGLRATVAPAALEILIVDNGSVEPQMLRLYDSLKHDSRIRVLHRPGPFNFALLCNEAAREAKGEILLFLNNDIEMKDGAWLAPLLDRARRPDIGAVGARLLYPTGRLQHGGVVLGMAGSTAHIDRGSRADDPGWLHRRLAPHEVSAVTGACLAVAKAKFDAVGGFDAEHFPIELNDIDLCLRLAARGWRTMLVPQSVLVHRESASRGTSTAQSGKYARERTLFAHRWERQVRDDPCFHPALSLVSVQTALG